MNKKFATRIGAIAGAALLSAATNVYALGDAADVWMKLVYKTTGGQQIDEVTGAISKAKSKGTCYSQLVYTPDADPLLPGTYAGDILCEDGVGDFVDTGANINLIELIGGDAAFAEGDVTTYSNPDAHSIRSAGNGLLTITKDKNSVFKKAKFKGIGALDAASLDGDTTLIGGVSVKGSSIDESKLPFVLP